MSLSLSHENRPNNHFGMFVSGHRMIVLPILSGKYKRFAFFDSVTQTWLSFLENIGLLNDSKLNCLRTRPNYVSGYVSIA